MTTNDAPTAIPAFAPVDNAEVVEFDVEAGTVDNPADAVGVGIKLELGTVLAAAELEMVVDVVGRSLLCQLIWINGA
jgi:hypothetical protein